jgi:hypothetical protein
VVSWVWAKPLGGDTFEIVEQPTQEEIDVLLSARPFEVVNHDGRIYGAFHPHEQIIAAYKDSWLSDLAHYL